MKIIKKNRIIKIGIVLCIFLVSVILIADLMISVKARSYVYDNINEIPANRVGVVLGCPKKLRNGKENYYFTYRIAAAVELYKSGKVDYLVVSGDNEGASTETDDMRNDLMIAGVPAKDIYMDCFGFRTLDSVIRMKETFGQQKFTIISQKFHNQRALLQADHYGLDAVGYNAQDVSFFFGLRTMVREKLARVKVFIDFFINKQPRVLGDKIEIK